MNGFGRYSLLVFVALIATISVGCAASRGEGCRDGDCRGSSTTGAIRPRQTEMALDHAADEVRRGKVQQTCPVTGEPLGSMGSPISVSLGAESLQVCCQGCVAAVKKNPNKYLKIVAVELAQSETSGVRGKASSSRPVVAERSSHSSEEHHH
ncbi:MAG: hypothetical protein Q8K78_03265 [Planctomycetaceae bacterium]|nr:hypothetical protein [Planctomycetaceae bacterium]